MVEEITREKVVRLNPAVTCPPKKFLAGMAGIPVRIEEWEESEEVLGRWQITINLPRNLNPPELVPGPFEGADVRKPLMTETKKRNRVVLVLNRSNLQKYIRETQGMEPEHEFWRIISNTIDRYSRTDHTLQFPNGGTLDLSGRPALMGVLNVTPDSFSDGGQYEGLDAALERAREMEEAGASIIDVGGESTRPGAEPVPVEEEIDRVCPVIERLPSEVSVPVSIDSRKPDVVEAALQAGASMINDVGGLTDEPEMIELAEQFDVPVIAMHMQGNPQNMQENPSYDPDPVTEILSFLQNSVAEAKDRGLPEEQLIVDPGIGFGKTGKHNREILRRAHEFRSLGLPVMLGTSRKSFIGEILGVPPRERQFGTAGSIAPSILSGLNLFRVHDVREIYQFLKVLWAVYGSTSWEESIYVD